MDEVEMGLWVNEKIISQEIAQQRGRNSGPHPSKSNRHGDTAEERKKRVVVSQDRLEADANRKSQGRCGEGNAIPESGAVPANCRFLCRYGSRVSQMHTKSRVATYFRKG
jgi:hypothetical protein